MIDRANKPEKTSLDMAGQVGAKAARKLQAQRNPTPGVWFGLGLMGVIGWSVVVPTLLGAALGLWLDRHYPGGHSWTLALMAAGLVPRPFIDHLITPAVNALCDRAGYIATIFGG